MIISLNKLNIETKLITEEIYGIIVTKNNFYSFLVIFYLIHRVFSVYIPQCVYACDISYYLIVSFIFKPLFIHVIMLFDSRIYLVPLCC